MKQKTIQILDGAMGTRLQALGLPLGGIPEQMAVKLSAMFLARENINT